MGYIQKDNVAYVSAKLTDYGRRKMAAGQLNFGYWGFGDSEIDYGSFETSYSWLGGGAGGAVDLGNLQILRPSDNPPDRRYPLLRVQGDSASTYTSIDAVDINETIINNQAVTRGFFTGTTATVNATTYPERKYNYFLRTADTYTKAVGIVDIQNTNFTPGNISTPTYGATSDITDISINGNEPAVGDFMLLVPNQWSPDTTAGAGTTLAGLPAGSGGAGFFGNSFIGSDNPIPYLWYRIQEIVSGTLAANNLRVKVDRQFPNFNKMNSTGAQHNDAPANLRDSLVYFYDGTDPINTYYGQGTTIPYWNELSLSFDSNCDVSVNDVKIWNMNIPWTQNVAGLANSGATKHDYTQYGSTGYTSTKEYLEYTKPVFSESYGGLVDDYRQKSIAVIHYSNNSISNFYGEGFYWADNGTNNFKLTFPTIMYHYTGNTTIGLMLTGETRSTPRQLLSTYNAGSAVNYYQLHTSGGTYYNNTTTTNQNIAPNSVGKIFPDLKIAVIDDEEIVSALSYKSNRNWTLPSLESEYITYSGISAAGNSGGALTSSGDQWWISYLFETMTGYTTGMHCNKYTFLSETDTNCSNCDGANKDISVKFPYGSLPFMKRAGVNVVGDASNVFAPANSWLATKGMTGWGAHKFHILIQKVVNNAEPDPAAWKRIRYTHNSAGQSIYYGDPALGTCTADAPCSIDTEILYNSTFTITLNGVGAAGALGGYNGSDDEPTGPNYSFNSFILSPSETQLADGTDKWLTFGDERFNFGNVDTDIKATVFRTTFGFNAGSAEFNTSQNPTFATAAGGTQHNVRISEVSVYDNNFTEVITGKISNPIEKKFGSDFQLYMGLDF